MIKKCPTSLGFIMIVFGLFLSSCVDFQNHIQLKLRLAPQSHPISLPSLSRFLINTPPTTSLEHDCYFVNVGGEGVDATYDKLPRDISASCLGLGTVSQVASLGMLTTQGLSCTVKSGAQRTIELRGLHGIHNCASSLTDILRYHTPLMHVLGSTTEDLHSDKQIVLQDIYSPTASRDLLLPCIDTGTLPSVSFSVTSQIVAESAELIQVEVSLSSPAILDVEIPFTVSGTADTSDHNLVSGIFEISVNSTSGIMAFNLSSDLKDEADETIVITLGTPVNASSGNQLIHSITITDDDYADLSVLEGSTSLSHNGTYSFGLNPTSLDAGATSFTLNNSGNCDLAYTSITLTGTNSSEFSISSYPSSSIAPSGTSTLGVKFLPLTSGAKTATLTINTNDPDTPAYSITLVGNTSWGSNSVSGSSATTGINHSATYYAYSPKLIELSNKLYCVWHESNLVRSAVYNGTDGSPSWSFVEGTGGVLTMNYADNNSAWDIEPVVFNSKLYAIWAEDNGSNFQTRVGLYGGNDAVPSWSFVDKFPVTTAGLNYNSSKSAYTPHAAVFNSKLYATWVESTTVTTPYQVRVAVYNGNDSSASWSFVDGNTTNGLNYNSSETTEYPRLIVFNNKLYLTWYESYSTKSQIRIAVYNGNDVIPSWTFVDSYPAASTGLNYSTSSNAQHCRPTVFNNKLYLIWSEYYGSYAQIRVKVYNGNDSSPSWSFVDGNSSSGLNYSSTRTADFPQLTAFKGKLYALWDEIASNGKAQIRIKTYNGNGSSPSWGFVDGNSATGINFNTSKEAQRGHFTVFNSKLYAAWDEENTSNVPQIRSSVANQQ